MIWRTLFFVFFLHCFLYASQPALQPFQLVDLPAVFVADSLDYHRIYQYVVQKNPSISDSMRQDIALAIVEAGRTENIDPKLIAAIIAVESRFNPRAHNRGAMGLGQLMRGTAQSLGIQDPYSVTQNALGTGKYLRKMLAEFEGHSQQIPLGLAAYMMGPIAAKRQVSRGFGQKAHKYVGMVLHQHAVVAGLPVPDSELAK